MELKIETGVEKLQIYEKKGEKYLAITFKGCDYPRRDGIFGILDDIITRLSFKPHSYRITDNYEYYEELVNKFNSDKIVEEKKHKR